MSMAEALNAEIARQTSILNELRLQNTDAAAIDAAKKKLSELKRSKATIPKAVHADADGASNESKRERLLLKTAKVGRTSALAYHPRSSVSNNVLSFIHIGHARLRTR